MAEAAPSWNHSYEAEQSVLGGLLLDNNSLDQVVDLLSPDDFYVESHRLIFRAIVAELGNGHPADPLTVADNLQRSGKLEEVGGAAYLGSITFNTPSAANIRRYAELVRDRSIARRLFGVARGICESVTATRGMDINQVLDSAQSQVLAVGDKAQAGQASFVCADKVMPEVLAFVDLQHERYASGSRDDVIGVPTGFVDLDRMTTGFHPGELIILAARPGMGKSALVLNMAEYAAVKLGQWAQVFTLEMRVREQGLRLLAAGAGVNVQRLVTGRVNDEEWPRVANASHKLADAKIAFNFTPGLTIKEMRALARRGGRELGKPCMIVLDYVQLMVADAENESTRATQLAEISRGAKLLAQEMEVPVILLSQLNREVEKRGNKRPVMSDLRDSGALEQDADVIMFIYRDEVYNKNSPHAGTAEIIIAKQRNGPIGDLRLTFRADLTRFVNYASAGM